MYLNTPTDLFCHLILITLQFVLVYIHVSVILSAGAFPLSKFPICTFRCVVCMCSYKEKEKVRTLPCVHEFHQGCIDTWLKV